jgi:uncharacterized protein (UPF0276 family)
LLPNSCGGNGAAYARVFIATNNHGVEVRPFVARLPLESIIFVHLRLHPIALIADLWVIDTLQSWKYI